MAVTSKTQNLSREQVAKVFADYGYKPTENDLIYWSSKPDSVYSTLISNLKIRRQKEDDARLKIDIEKKKATQGDKESPVSTAQKNIQGTSGTVVSQIGGKTKNYNMGEYSLVKFDNSPTVFLVDFNNKELRPFLSEDAFNTSYPHPEEAWKSIHVLSSKEHTDPLGAFGDFNILSSEYGISNNGTFLKDPDYRLNNVKKKYNQQEVQIDQAIGNSNKLFYILNGFSKNNQSKMDSGFLNKQINNPELMAFYANAITYGGYTMNDIYKDLKKREMQEKGDKTYENVKYIDDIMPKNQYVTTPKGQFADRDLRISVPTEFIADNPNLWNMPISQMPQEAFRNIDQELDLGSAKNKAEAEKIQSAFHDVLSAKLTATNEAQKDFADYQYDQFVNDIERQYGIKLSSNASTAWNQLENLLSEETEAGLAGSGIAQEQIDEYLKGVRKQQDQLRQQKLTDEEKQQADYIRKFGSSDQIKKMDEEDKAKGLPQDQWRSVKWGLKPNQELLNSISAEALKKKFPELTDQEIEDYRKQIIDDNGNFRSDLYQKQYEQMYRVRYGKTLEERFNESLSDYQKRKQQEKLLEEEAQKMKEFTQRQDDFSKEAIVPEKPKGEVTPEKPETEWKFDKDQNKWIEQEKQPEAPKSGVGDVYGEKIPGTWSPPTGKTHILTPSDMSKYTDIEKDPYSDKLYGKLKQPEAQKKVEPVYTPPAGKTHILSPSEMYKYTDIEKDPYSNKLYGKLKQQQQQPQVQTQPIVQTKPIGQIQQQTQTKPVWTPPSGKQYITSPSEMSKYTNIEKDPNSNKLYGTIKQITQKISAPTQPVQQTVKLPTSKPPAVPTPPKQPVWNPPTGYQHILTPGDIPKYTNVTKDPYSSKLYGKLK